MDDPMERAYVGFTDNAKTDELEIWDIWQAAWNAARRDALGENWTQEDVEQAKALLKILNTGFVKSLELDDSEWTLTWWNDDTDEFELSAAQGHLGKLATLFHDFICNEKTYDEIVRALGTDAQGGGG